LLFPDPWPKRRHAGRRVVSSAFLRAVARALRSNGVLHMATDDEEYFTRMRAETAAFPALLSSNDIAPGRVPFTTFEERFRSRGLAIHRLTLRKVSPPR
ncbi:MAG TPA: hypothetical protein VG095_05115, partial [Chthoniobacterales bacterium]|nr:hypothetical protein [Chthoniobacterales bacterium]